MKNLIFVFIVLFPGVFHCRPQLLWKISGEGMEPSYIFGTHHVAPVSICDSIDGFEEAFNSCKQVYGEIVTYNMEDMAIDMWSYMVLPADSLLDVVYGTEDYKLLDGILRQYLGIGAGRLKNMKPVVIQSQLTRMLCMRIFTDYNPDEILDAVIQKRAREKDMPVKGFETVPYQAKLIYGIPIQKQASDLMLMLRNFDRFEKYSMFLCNAYTRQDLEVLHDIMEDPEFGSTAEEMELLVYNRNKDWAEQLKEILPKYPVFIAVGAGHLPGGRGLINLLRKYGFKVTPV